MNKIYTPQREQSAVLGDPERRGAGGGGWRRLLLSLDPPLIKHVFI